MIEVHNLKKEYVSGVVKKRVTTAPNGIDLSVPKGTVFGLTGESGCGKTTLAMLIMRLTNPTSGSVIIDGKDITRLNGTALRKLRPMYQIIWQNPDASLNPRMKLKDKILEPLRYHEKCKNGDQDAIIEKYCGMAELPENLLNRYPHEPCSLFPTTFKPLPTCVTRRR